MRHGEWVKHNADWKPGCISDIGKLGISLLADCGLVRVAVTWTDWATGRALRCGSCALC